MDKKTLVISAFPCCGKSYAYKNYQDQFSMLDSDSSEYSWIKDKNGFNTNVRNPEFLKNYIQHIKDNLGKVDIIFVSSHEVVRDALRSEDIQFITVYPEKHEKVEWVRRMYRRGDSEGFIDFIVNNWDEFMIDIEYPDSRGLFTFRLSKTEYLDPVIIDLIRNRLQAIMEDEE